MPNDDQRTRTLQTKEDLAVSKEQMGNSQEEQDEVILPRLYFSTRSRLYELLYQRHPVGNLENPFVEVSLYALDFLSTLRELPFTSDSWFQVIEALEEERAALLHLSPKYSSRLGHFSRKTPAAQPLDVNCVVLLRPSHTTPEIAHLVEQDADLWYQAALYRQDHEQAAPPPEPSDSIACDQAGFPLFDVFARGRLLGALVSYVRLPFEQAYQLGCELASREKGILLRYNDLVDTLEWIKFDDAVSPGNNTSMLLGGKEARGDILGAE